MAKVENKKKLITKASSPFVRGGARKARLVADLIRNKISAEAIVILKRCNKRAAKPIADVLNSAISNAVNNDQLNADLLYVSTIMINEGPTLKRLRPRAKGSADRIFKRTYKILIELSEAKR